MVRTSDKLSLLLLCLFNVTWARWISARITEILRLSIDIDNFVFNFRFDVSHLFNCLKKKSRVYYI